MKEAREQLEELWKRVPVEEQVNANNAAPPIAAALKPSSPIAPAAAAATTAMSSSNTANHKEKAELPVATNPENKFADSDEFLGAIVKLIPPNINH